jgi:DNA helicase HerA-like ATPase
MSPSVTRMTSDRPSRSVGHVDSVSPAQISVTLDVEAPHATALSSGLPIAFPRINGYLVIPVENGLVVGLVTWLGIEHSAFPKRAGLKDFGLVDLPFPLRRMRLVPLGTLTPSREPKVGEPRFKLSRGVAAFPSVGDSVLLPTTEELTSIIEAQGDDRRVQIGTSPLLGNAKIFADPNKLFGRHLAVLGNTGSGKSCTVAGLIRWSILSAEQERGAKANARFIVLDPNGEYSRAFTSDGLSAKVFKIKPNAQQLSLRVPAWMWNSHEWAAFSSASPAAQRPVLIRALRQLREKMPEIDPKLMVIRRTMFGRRLWLKSTMDGGTPAYTETREASNVGRILKRLEQEARSFHEESEDELAVCLKQLADTIEPVTKGAAWPNGRDGYNAFSTVDLQSIADALDSVNKLLPDLSIESSPGEDAPIAFNPLDLPELLEFISSDGSAGNVSQFIATLVMRIRTMLGDLRLSDVVAPTDEVLLEQWLNDYIGSDASSSPISIIDLSLVPSDVLHIVTAVLARLIFEATQRYMQLNDSSLPTVLVLEEAHTFIQQGSNADDGLPSPLQMCRRTFERIAREGRKFGLGLVLSSQRPSELSPTVLSQCNSFLLHRIVNDRDQELIGRLVPDNLGDLLKELPTLPSQQAILLGWASPVPVLVDITTLEDSQRPRSDDPHFWEIWTGQQDRPVDWAPVVEEWTS